MNTIKKIRKSHKHTQKFIAELLEISQPYYSYLESNSDEIKLGQLKVLSEIWQCDLNSLAGNDSNKIINELIRRRLEVAFKQILDEFE